MAKNSTQKILESTVEFPFDTESLLNHSRQELIELAKNLSDGKFEKDSQQRDKIMQMLVKQLSSLEAT